MSRSEQLNKVSRPNLNLSYCYICYVYVGSALLLALVMILCCAVGLSSLAISEVVEELQASNQTADFIKWVQMPVTAGIGYYILRS